MNDLQITVYIGAATGTIHIDIPPGLSGGGEHTITLSDGYAEQLYTRLGFALEELGRMYIAKCDNCETPSKVLSKCPACHYDFCDHCNPEHDPSECLYRDYDNIYDGQAEREDFKEESPRHEVDEIDTLLGEGRR